MKVQLTPEESETHFFDALCNGLQEMHYYGLELQYSDEDYESAKQSIIERLGNNHVICYEDVLMEILKMGNMLSLADLEGGEDTHVIFLKEVHERVSNTPINHLMDAINENGDAITADVIIQTVFLNDVIYG
jgi:hypothetical protein